MQALYAHRLMMPMTEMAAVYFGYRRTYDCIARLAYFCNSVLDHTSKIRIKHIDAVC